MYPHESDWWKRFSESCRQEADGWQVCTGLTMYEAEQLLDWLEVSKKGQREVSLVGPGVTVRWRE